jgi:plasmid maintenance system antidote protein VapI
VPLLTPADIRAELARRRLPVYQLAAWVQLHPSRLSAVLNERTRLSPQLAERIARAFEELEWGRPGDEG